MATYEISYVGSDEVSHAHGETRSQAKYNHYQRVGDCFGGFSDFLKAIRSVRKVPHVVGAYAFIQRQYGVSFDVGQTVKIVGEGSMNGKVGETVHPSGQGSYVSVLVDGSTWLFHPMSLEQEPDQ